MLFCYLQVRLHVFILKAIKALIVIYSFKSTPALMSGKDRILFRIVPVS